MSWNNEPPTKDGWFWALHKDQKAGPVEVRDNCTHVFIPNLLDPSLLDPGNVGYVTWVFGDGKILPINSDLVLGWGEEILMGERPQTDVGMESSIRCYQLVLLTIKNKVVLDFGCGIGIGSNFIKPYCKDVFSYDISTEALQKGRETFPELKFVENYMSTRPDIVVMCEVLEHLEKEDAEKTLGDFRSLCPELFITTPNGDFFKYHPDKDKRHGFHTWHYQYEELQELFHKYYEHVEIFGAAYDLRHSCFTTYAVYASNRMFPPT